MISKSCVIQRLKKNKEDYRTDTEAGRECADTYQSFIDFIEELPSHSNKDLILDLSLEDWRDAYQDTCKEIEKRKKEKLNKIHTVNYILNGEVEDIYYVKKEEDLLPLVKKLIEKAPLELIGMGTYECLISYLTDDSLMYINYEEL